MAIRLPGLKETFEVVLRGDSALDVTDEQYAEYLTKCDLSLLKMVEGQQPTRFVMRKVLPMRLTQKLQSHVKYNPTKGGGNPVDVDFLAYMMEEVRCAICGIIDPDGSNVFESAPDGGASEDLLAQLNEIGAVTDMFTARRAMTTKTEPDKKK